MDTHTNTSLVPTGSTVAVYRKDGRPWTHGIVVGHGTEDLKCKKLQDRVTKMRCTNNKGKYKCVGHSHISRKSHKWEVKS